MSPSHIQAQEWFGHFLSQHVPHLFLGPLVLHRLDFLFRYPNNNCYIFYAYLSKNQKKSMALRNVVYLPDAGLKQ